MNFIKYFFVVSLFALTNSVFSQKDPVVMSVDNQNITKSEFLRVYLKNNSTPKYDKASLDEYMDLYVKFRLKVKEAEDLGYDTIPSLKRELDGYKNQLAQPYLVDTTKNNELIEEAYERMKYEVRASHILIQVGVNASPEDTLKAYNKIMALKMRIDNGEDFAEVASGQGGSEDPSVAHNRGDLGYFTAFQMVYPFENAAYNTPIGSVSMPIRSSYGYHILKIDDKRPARGTITTAHIMIVFSESQGMKYEDRTLIKANEIYEKLEEGEDFAKLARLYSDDQGTRQNGGILPPFGSGTNQRMVTEFEDAAFALENDGDYTKPFKTDYGYHIVQRIDYKPLGSFEELLPMIKQKVKQGDRAKQSEDSFILQLKKQNKFKDKGTKGLKVVYQAIDSTIYNKDWEIPTLKKNKWLFKYNKKKYLAQDFVYYLAKNKNNAQHMPVVTLINTRYKDWQDYIIMSEEKANLSQKHPEYKALLQEYHDGVLLYEIMKDMVWDKAIKDTTGLKEYFEANIAKYQWPDRIDAVIFSAVDKEHAIEAGLLANSDTLSVREIIALVNVESQLSLKAEEGKFIQADKEALAGRTFNLGNNAIYQFGDKYYLVRVREFLPAGPKELNETRGAVIQDYQDALENQWLENLRRKHDVKIYDKVLYSIGE